MEFLRTALPFWALFLLTWVCVVYFFIYEEPRCLRESMTSSVSDSSEPY